MVRYPTGGHPRRTVEVHRRTSAGVDAVWEVLADVALLVLTRAIVTIACGPANLYRLAMTIRFLDGQTRKKRALP
jgi:hypothetical protein